MSFYGKTIYEYDLFSAINIWPLEATKPIEIKPEGILTFEQVNKQIFIEKNEENNAIRIGHYEPEVNDKFIDGDAKTTGRLTINNNSTTPSTLIKFGDRICFNSRYIDDKGHVIPKGEGSFTEAFFSMPKLEITDLLEDGNSLCRNLELIKNEDSNIVYLRHNTPLHYHTHNNNGTIVYSGTASLGIATPTDSSKIQDIDFGEVLCLSARYVDMTGHSFLVDPDVQNEPAALKQSYVRLPRLTWETW